MKTLLVLVALFAGDIRTISMTIPSLEMCLAIAPVVADIGWKHPKATGEHPFHVHHFCVEIPAQT